MKLSCRIILTIFLMAISSDANASDNKLKQTLTAFDAFCISTRLDLKIFNAQVKLFKHKKMSDDMLHNMSPDNEIGYWVFLDDLLVAVLMGRKKTYEGEDSLNCTVTIKDLTFLEATSILNDNFPIKKVDYFKQGVSQISLFQGILAGFGKKMMLSVQSGEGMTSLSIIEMPDKW